MSAAEQLIPLITGVLSANKEDRDSAQAQLDAGKTHADYATSLLTILLCQEGPLATRQMAGVLLKQFVESSWSDYPHTQSKEIVKTQILPGLSDSISKIRASVAHVISEIAVLDFPENWVTLFDDLLQMLGTGEANKVHGVMRVLSELANDITDNQVYAVAPILFPQLAQLFKTEQLDAVTRARALSIFGVFVTLISHMDSVDPKANENLLFPILPDLIDGTVAIIAKPVSQKEEYKLVTECVNFLAKLVQTFPKQMADKVPKVLPTLWQLLTNNANTYITGVVNNPDYDEDSAVDSDGNDLSFGAIVQAIFEFIQCLTERKKYKAMIRKVLPDIMYYLITYLSLPDYQIGLWDSDPEKYVEDDDEDSMNYTVRTGAMELIIDLASELKTTFVESLVAAIARHVSSCGAINEANNWKIYEACVTALNISGDAVEECLEQNKVSFSFGAFYNTVVIPGLQSDKPYLLGRLMWLTSSFVKRMPSEQAVADMLEGICKALKPGTSAPVMIGAMKGVYALCAELEEPEEQVVLHKAMESIIPSLFDLAANMEGDLLMLCLDTLRVSIAVRTDIVATEADKVNKFLVELFVKHADDTFVVGQVNEVLTILAGIPECRGSIENNVVPILLQILKQPTVNSPKKQSEEDEEDMRVEVLELMTTFVRKTPSPLPQIYINDVYPVVMSVTVASAKDSSAILQSGGECVRAFLAQGFQQLMQLNINGISGSDYVLQLIGILLDPAVSEYGALYTGKLVSSMIHHTGPSLNIKDILQAVLNKLATCEAPTVQQSLLVVFIKLFNQDLEGSITFLQGLSTPSGDNALVYILKTWVEIQEMFTGEFETKLAVMAFTKFLPLIMTGDSPLKSIMICDDEVHLEGGRITRSNKEQATPVMIPITVKIFKILVTEFGNILESKQAGQIEEDSEDDEADDEEEVVPDQFISLAQLAAFVGEDDDDDEDNKADPLYNADLYTHLQQFLTQLSTHGQYNDLCMALNDSERKVLSSMQVIGS